MAGALGSAGFPFVPHGSTGLTPWHWLAAFLPRQLARQKFATHIRVKRVIDGREKELEVKVFAVGPRRLIGLNEIAQLKPVYFDF
jgi:hypothetical protein